MSTKDWIRFWFLGLIWGTSFLWIKIAVSEISPLVLVGFRTLFGAAFLFGVITLGGRTRLRWQELRPWLGVFSVVALINVAIPFVLISWSEQYITSGIASILNSSVPLFTILLAPFLLQDDQPSPAKILGLLIGFAGIVVIFLPELAQGMNQNLIGMGVMLLAALSYSLGGIYSRLKAQTLPPQVQAFLQLALAALIIWSVTLLAERPPVLPQQPLTWIALLWLGILGSGLAYILFFSLLHKIGPTRTTTVTYIPPLVGTLLGMLFLGERITWLAIAGGLMVISGIVVINLKHLPGFISSSQTSRRQTVH